MKHHAWIGIDNGTSGSIGVISENNGNVIETHGKFIKTPTKSELSYTKEKKFITRIDAPALAEIFGALWKSSDGITIALERPFVNPKMFVATLSAIRALEATICVLETLQLPYFYIDSRQWQKAVLPSGLRGTDELKKASLDIGRRLYPQVAAQHPKAKDFDGLLIAHWLRTNRELF